MQEVLQWPKSWEIITPSTAITTCSVLESDFDVQTDKSCLELHHQQNRNVSNNLTPGTNFGYKRFPDSNYNCCSNTNTESCLHEILKPFIHKNHQPNSPVIASDDQTNLIGDHTAPHIIKFCISNETNPHCSKPIAAAQQDQSRDSSSSSVSCTNSGSVVWCKKRIRWTRELHEQFVQCVINLGGSEMATPKAILKMMKTKGLTIFHVKSHLQKYRAEEHVSECKRANRPILLPESTVVGSVAGRGTKTISDITRIYSNSSLQIKEALKLLLKVEKHLLEQLEMQHNLQVQIEKNLRQLKNVMDQYHIKSYEFEEGA